MEIQFLPAFEERPVEGSLRQRPYIFVRIGTPRVPQTDRNAVAVFFIQHNTMLSILEDRGEQIFSFLVNVRSIGALMPPSLYLESLCAFLREHPFVVAPRTQHRPLMLTVSLSEEEGGGDAAAAAAPFAAVDRSHPDLAVVTSKICRAFWQNAHVRASRFLFVDAVAAPDSAAIDEMVHGRSVNANPSITLRVCDNPDREEMGPDVLEVRLAGANFVASGAAHVSALARSVLASTVPVVGFFIYSKAVAEAVASALVEHSSDGTYFSARFAVGVNHSALRMAGRSDGATDTGTGTGIEARLDGTALCVAAMRCSSVGSVCFDRFYFSPRTVAAVQGVQRAAAAAASGGAARSRPIAILQFRGCTFDNDRDDPGAGSALAPSGPSIGFCNLVKGMSCSMTLHVLEITDATLGKGDLTSLVGMLISPECSIDTLKLGGSNRNGEPCLEREFVSRFFQNLPLMNWLVNLTFSYAAPAGVTPTIVDGVKRNYSLRKLDGLTFETELDPNASSSSYVEEIGAYLTANARGREVVARAAASPSNRALQDETIEVIRFLADSDDTTSLYLCLQLFLPTL